MTLATRHDGSVRVIGIRPMALTTSEDEKHPTEVVITEEGKGMISIEIETPQGEIDFILGHFGIGRRKPNEGEDISQLPAHLVSWSKTRKTPPKVSHPSQRRKVPGRLKKDKPLWVTAVKVPKRLEGLRKGDTVVMAMGGHGRELARNIGHYGASAGFTCRRIAPYLLKDEREKRGMRAEEDTQLLVMLFKARPQDFHLVRELEVRAARLITLEKKWANAQQERIRMNNRVYSRARFEHLDEMIGRRERGGDTTPAETLDAVVERALDADAEYQLWDAQEKRTFRELEDALEFFPIYKAFFQPTIGIGVSIAARIIAGVGDFRSFILQPTAEQEEAYAEFSRQIGLSDKAGNYDAVKSSMGATLSEGGANGWERRNRAKKYWLERGRDDMATHMRHSRDLLQERAKLKKEWYGKGMSKFRAICNAHVNPDGTFPRFRRGAKNDWPKGRPVLKQAGYLFGDQSQRRKDGKWAVQMRLNMVRQRELKGEKRQVETPDGLKWRYTDAHILKMARWRTYTQFINELYKVWREIELRSTTQDLAQRAAA